MLKLRLLKITSNFFVLCEFCITGASYPVFDKSGKKLQT